MDIDLAFYFKIALSAGTGTVIVEIFFKSFLEDWLKRQSYKFKLSLDDKRACADKILKIISADNFEKWSNSSDGIYHNAYDLSIKLWSIGEKKASKKLDSFVSAKRHEELIIKKAILSDDPEITKDFLASQKEVDEKIEDLIKISKELIK